MFFGRHDTVIGRGWRLNIPAAFANDFLRNPNSMRIIVMEGRTCVKIYPYREIGEHDGISPSDVADVKLGKKEHNGSACLRMVIPEMFRDSLSFHYGKTVTIAGNGDHIEIWPRPARSKTNKRGRPSTQRKI
jgi:DNA-binding transcriptional regulator/RsmH inhibitor MraZ